MIDAQQIGEVGRRFGIDEIKTTTAQPFEDAGARIKEQREAGLFLGSERWYRRDIDSFCDARTVLPEARSIIAACQCYLTGEAPGTHTPGNPHGLIARYTWRNHYADLKERLTAFAAALRDEYTANSVVFSNGEIAEKPAAQRSGIGYYGKNCLIINRRFGSRIVLGEIITDIEIAPDAPQEPDCSQCTKCIDACPTGALVKPYVLDRRRCIQALTNWYGVLPGDIARAWGARLYGCDDCQDACPANRYVETKPARTMIGYVGPSIPLNEILSMSEDEYRKKYARNQITARWVDFRAIQRNALVALGNIRDPLTVPVLTKYVKNEDPVLARTAQWSLDNF
ncbi:tRNA epoxyqueuosine(34) reductase QueG [candidate division WOR-3 bacterium]|nr:tRNA epoxyqueuosine(34) reductase QueG [candidate division WOR-3 bacterium]